MRTEFCLEVAFVEWETFRDIMIEPSDHNRKSIAQKACAIIGGVDLALEIK
jgi:hypothetical protein